MIREIRTYPDPILREVCKPALSGETNIAQIAMDLLDTLYSSGGVGLAAPQIGESLRIFVVDIDWVEGKAKPRLFVNPTIIEKSDPRPMDEGCLSFPNKKKEIIRANKITVRNMLLGGQTIIKAEGYLAQAIQHEYDHLAGKLLIDDPMRA